jgi:hypothetical protein
VDAAGVDVTPANIQGPRTLQVSFTAGANFSLILDRTELWDSHTGC